MDKKQYFNSITEQVFALKDLAKIQADKCFDIKKMEAMLDPGTAAGIKRIIVTGCGDSYSAAGAMRPALMQFSGIRACNTPDAIDFCRFYSNEKICKNYQPQEILIIAVSFSGNSVQAAEALERANEMGAHSLLITRSSDSKAGAVAVHVFNVETPEGCNTPGLRSYYASLVALSAVGAYLGLCKGSLTESRFTEIKDQISDYVISFMAKIDAIDDQMFDLAVKMKDLQKFEVIADWNEGFSAQFVEQKFIECGGVFCDHTTSEEFAHISFFQREPSTYGMVVMINAADPSFSRMRDTIGGCLKQHRPTLVVTDAAPQEFEVSPKKLDIPASFFEYFTSEKRDAESTEKPVVCQLPVAPEPWMSPLIDFIPGALLAGYQAAVNERFFFNGRYDFRNQIWSKDV